MKHSQIIRKGAIDGLQTTWELAKVIVPVYFIITFLKYTPILDWLIKMCTPLTSIVGLPGEAALPIVLANTLTIYPAIPAIMAFPFTSKEITIIATMILISHGLPVEGAVAKKAGVSMGKITVLRIFFSILSGVFLNIIL